MKPCPFCGNKDVEVTQEWEIEGYEEDEDDYWIVCCSIFNNGCGASCGFKETKEEAIEAWEKRYEEEN